MALPQDMITEILLMLPVKSLLRFKSVSKEWLFIISSPHFIKAQLKFSTKNNIYIHDKIIFCPRYPPPTDLCTSSFHSVTEGFDDNFMFDRVPFNCPPDVSVTDDMSWLPGSCNGLVCVCLSPHTNILLNPTTRESRILPDPFPSWKPAFGGTSCAFGYDELRDDYKVVVIIEIKEGKIDSDNNCVLANVFSMRNNSWKILENFPNGEMSLRRSGKSIHGGIHWLLLDLNRSEEEWFIVCHVLATDAFVELPIPEIDDEDDCVGLELDLLGDHLVACCEYEDLYMDVWMMKEYGVRESWTKLLRVPISRGFSIEDFPDRPCTLFFSVDGKILINKITCLRIYDSGNLQSNLLGWGKNVNGPVALLEATTYFESLVSPYLDG